MWYWAGLLCLVSGVMWHLMLWNYFLTQFKKKRPALNPHLFLPTIPHPHQSPRHWVYFLPRSLPVFSFSKPFFSDLKCSWRGKPSGTPHAWILPRQLISETRPFLFRGRLLVVFLLSFFRIPLSSEFVKATNKQNKQWAKTWNWGSLLRDPLICFL